MDSYELALELGQKAKRRGVTVATAESCTAGGLGFEITAVPGSSEWYERGFITYTNRAKEEMLGVKAETLAAFGAVSWPERWPAVLWNIPVHNFPCPLLGLRGQAALCQVSPWERCVLAWH